MDSIIDSVVLIRFSCASSRDLRSLLAAGIGVRVASGITIANEVRVHVLEPKSPTAFEAMMVVEGKPRDLVSMLKAGLVLHPKKDPRLVDGDVETELHASRALFSGGIPPENPIRWKEWTS